MRDFVDADRLRAFLKALGEAARTPVEAYLVGGATAVLEGWRPATIDVDLTFAPESREVYEAIPALKVRLGLNVELASPAHFVPELPGWRDRCRFVGTFGRLTVFHYDPYGQVLAKVERGHEQDLADVRRFVESGLVEPDRLRALYDRVAHDVVRYPAVDGAALRRRLEALR